MLLQLKKSHIVGSSEVFAITEKEVDRQYHDGILLLKQTVLV